MVRSDKMRTNKKSMKKGKTFLLNYGFLIFLELVFSVLIYDSYLRSTIINILLYQLPVAIFITIITNIFNNKVNKIMMYITYSILGFLFALEFVFRSTFRSYFSLSIFKLTEQAFQFGEEAVVIILKNLYLIVLFFVPLILLIVFRKKIVLNSNKLKHYLVFLPCLIIGIFLFYLNLQSQKEDNYGAYQLYYELNDNSLNIEKLGILNSLMLDIYRTSFGFEEKIKTIDHVTEDDNDIFDYDYNVLDIDFSSLKSNNPDIKLINQYMDNDIGTKQNKYTGIFKGMNLIYITAESFNQIGVSETLTPTLYKLVNTGFVFGNFYTSNNLSTIGGEFQSTTGLYADSSMLNVWRSGSNLFPYGLANMFKNIGYNTFAYHNHYYDFQDRNVYLKSLGFDNYKACYKGLERFVNCEQWPESDVEMINATVDDYINSETPFLAYYMTVSGHFQYTWEGNSIARKNKDLVNNLNYSEKIKAYLATQIELDRALEILLEKLEASDQLDNTVIVLLADHYPYALSTNQINEVSSYTKDSVIEVDHSNLIIWNNKLKKINIDKVCMSIDVIPTVYNLFGLDYDSRLFMGKDIFSTTGGLAMFKNRSWVTNNGTYYSANGNYITLNDNMTMEYINNINSVVSNRINISRLLVKTDYYRYLQSNQ